MRTLYEGKKPSNGPYRSDAFKAVVLRLGGRAATLATERTGEFVTALTMLYTLDDAQVRYVSNELDGKVKVIIEGSDEEAVERRIRGEFARQLDEKWG